MKYVLLLLMFCTVCRGQNEFDDYTKVTAYRLINEYDDGFCNIVNYLKDAGIGWYIQAKESNDPNFARELIRLKKETLSWPFKKFSCRSNCIGCDTVDCMYIIEVNKYRDTIFATGNNQYIFDPVKQIAYIDEHQALKTLLPYEVKLFFDYNFNSEFEKQEIDSISYDKVKYRNKTIYNYNRKEFETNFGPFELIKTEMDSLGYENRMEKRYYIQNCMIQFQDNYNHIQSFTSTYDKWEDKSYREKQDLIIDGLVCGDTEQKLIAKFQQSSRYKYHHKAVYNLDQLKGDYYYEIRLIDKKGHIVFNIKKKIITSIQIEFDYP